MSSRHFFRQDPVDVLRDRMVNAMDVAVYVLYSHVLVLGNLSGRSSSPMQHLQADGDVRRETPMLDSYARLLARNADAT
jgi:hypothetical protein